jgi:hypothetical protein
MAGMKVSLEALRDKVYAQKERIPSLYGDVDFDCTPERFTADPGVKSMLPMEFDRQFRADVLKDADRVERARLYTMLGDTVADAYAALVPEYGMGRLIGMLKQACDEGLEAVDNPPQELVDFIGEMERVPDWLDMDLVNRGARAQRNYMANMTPFAIRGAFIATFMNKYSGLPMALTGALSGESSRHRVNETASFFTTACLPGALERHGQGFKAAAMVRLMHSMVRFNILKRSQKWDQTIYGIPIPQVDQMPAGTIPSFIMSFDIVQKGKRRFNARERGIVELCRYQSYLLGLPEDLLPDTPEEIFDVMLTYAATLRDGYDDDTCGELVRSTMDAYRPSDKTIKSRVFNEVEKRFSRVFFTNTFLRGADKSRARKMHVQPSLLDYAVFGAASLHILPRLQADMIAQRLPIVNRIADRFLINRLNDLLVEYGHAEYVTDASKYKDASKQPATPSHA